MEKKVVASLEYGAAKNGATISILPSLNCILLEWKGDVLIDEWIEILSRAIEEIKIHKITNWIGDTSNLGATGEAHDLWVQNEFVPMAAEAGLQKLVVLLPDDILGEMAMQELMENLKNAADSNRDLRLKTIYTKDLNEAYQWIETGKLLVS